MFGLVPYNRRRGLQRDEVFNLRNFIDNFFEDDSLSWAGDRTMKVDIKDKKDEFILEAEIPGVDKKDVKLNIKDNLLTILVEKEENKEEKSENYIRKERRYGSYSRCFNVDDIDTDNISAKHENGVLTIHLPKKKVIEAKESNIEIE